MIRTALTHHMPKSLQEASDLLGELNGTAAVLGGGTMLLPAMGRGERTHEHVVDLRRLGLSGITTTGDEVEIGAMTTYSAVLGSAVDGPAGLLEKVAGGITGGPQLRNQGTLGGSASYANPSSDVPAALVAARARLSLHGANGVRDVPAAEFFRDAFATALAGDEILTTIRIPRTDARTGYYKLKLSESSWPIATGAARAEYADGRLSSATVTLGGVCSTPVTVDVTECVDDFGALTVSDRQWAELVEQHLESPWQDELAPASYRRHVAGAVARRAWEAIKEGKR
jgi:CO/xanthine dehydrogenase FAD-binding subunit